MTAEPNTAQTEPTPLKITDFQADQDPLTKGKQFLYIPGVVMVKHSRIIGINGYPSYDEADSGEPETFDIAIHLEYGETIVVSLLGGPGNPALFNSLLVKWKDYCLHSGNI